MIKKRYILLYLLIALLAGVTILTIPFGKHSFMPETDTAGSVVPLDPESPWPRFRANSLQNGRTDIIPQRDDSHRPWEYTTGKGIFSSPVVDKNGTVYIGSADHYFYALHRDGSLKWRYRTGEIIDSSALLDNTGSVYFGSGDGNVYALDRETGELLWKSPAHSVEEVQEEFGLKTYNVNWFEGNIGMLPDGTLLAPNDNYLVYRLDRETGKQLDHYKANEMVWSLPAVNTSTGWIFFGTQFMALKNLYSYDTKTGDRRWTAGGLGSNAASPLLTSNSERGAVILGGYDGFLRAYSQKSGKQLWKLGVRDHIYASPAQLSDGTIIQASADGTIYGIDPEKGKVVWAYDTLEPVRSSPAVDGLDQIYVGSGEGRLFCLNPDGSLRWSYLCIDEDRNDLNASPALGADGVYIAGESGGIFFVPYDYPLSPAGLKDPRCTLGPGEALPDDGAFMVFTGRFGGLYSSPPASIDPNQSLAFTLVVREKGDTIKTAIDPKSLEIEVSGNPLFLQDISAHRQFVLLNPQEIWSRGGELTVSLRGTYRTGLRRIGLKFFGGKTGGSFDHQFHFTVSGPSGPKAEAVPYFNPREDDGRSTVFEFSRLAAPNPTMLPSWNQIGFDSLHYLGGVVGKVSTGHSRELLLWIVGGRLEDGETLVDPELEVRYPMVLRYDQGALTLYNYDGFKINFIGSWDMPFAYYRVAAMSDPVTGEVLTSPTLSALSLGDDIAFYGRFLKLMGMTDFRTGHMPVFGGKNMALHGKGFRTAPEGVGSPRFFSEAGMAAVELDNSSLKTGEHVYSLIITDAENGTALPLYYSNKTMVTSDASGTLRSVSISWDKKEIPETFSGTARAIFMVDTYPAAESLIELER